MEERTDWLWGIGAAYNFIHLDTGVLFQGDHEFSSFNEDISVVLQYLPFRITDVGFPCLVCKLFVFWDSGYFTKYHHFLYPLTDWGYQNLFTPRIYLCTECGVSSPDRFTFDWSSE